RAGEGRGELRQVRPRLRRVLAGRGDDPRHRDPGAARMAAEAGRADAERRGEEADRSARRLGEAHGDAETAPRGAEGPPPGRRRKFAREGAPEEFDLENTIQSTARKAYLDIHMRPERRNAIKVLMLMDIGGTMDDHVKLAAELFSAAKTEFKHLEFFYFHNCLYDFVWKDNRRSE